MTKTTPAQDAKLGELRVQNRALKTFKANALEEAMREIEAEVISRQAVVALLAREAKDMGATQSAIGRALGTKDRRTVIDLLAQSTQLRESAKPVVSFPEPGRMVMVLTGESVPNYGEFTGELNFLWSEGYNEWDIDYDAEGINTKAANEILGVLLNPEHPEYKKWKDLVTR